MWAYALVGYGEAMRLRLIAPPWYTVPPVGYGGIELVVALLAQELDLRGHEVTVVASGGSDPAGKLRSPLASPPDHGLIGDACFEAFHALSAYADLDGADVINDHSGVVGPALAARDPSLPPVVHTLHGPWNPATRALYGLVDERVHLVAISQSQRADNPDLRYAATIHNGVDTDGYPMSDRPHTEELIFIGRASPDKNPAGAIRIARASGRPLILLTKRHEGPERDYWHNAVAPLLGDDIEVVENVDHDTKVQLLQRAHAMVFPIQWPEPFGLVIAEAMACGTPVIASALGAAPELIEHGRTGFLCRMESDMAAAVDQIARLDRNACHERVESCFSARKMAAEYERVFERLLDAS